MRPNIRRLPENLGTRRPEAPSAVTLAGAGASTVWVRCSDFLCRRPARWDGGLPSHRTAVALCSVPGPSPWCPTTWAVTARDAAINMAGLDGDWVLSSCGLRQALAPDKGTNGYLSKY